MTAKLSDGVCHIVVKGEVHEISMQIEATDPEVALLNMRVSPPIEVSRRHSDNDFCHGPEEECTRTEHVLSTLSVDLWECFRGFSYEDFLQTQNAQLYSAITSVGDAPLDWARVLEIEEGVRYIVKKLDAFELNVGGQFLI